MNETVGFLIIDEQLFNRVKAKGPPQAHRNLGQINDGAGAVSILFIQSEFFPGSDCLEKVCHLRLWVWKCD